MSNPHNSDSDVLYSWVEEVSLIRGGPEMGDRMTIGEMHTKYPELWLLVEDIETTEKLTLVSGCVTFVSKDKDEVYQIAIERKPKRSSLIYTGQFPQDSVFVL